MSKNIKILLVLVLLAGVAYFFISRKPWNTTHTERKDFAITDTANISKIFLADRKNNKVLMEKDENGYWKINGSIPADVQKVNLLKATIHDVEVRNPITEKEFNNVVANLASNAIKAEFYQGDKLIKIIYIGEATPDGTGTYMMIEGSNTPFVTHIPGFVGYLTPRFLTNAVKWKDKLVFNFTEDIISVIKVHYPSDDKLGFSIENSVQPLVKSGNNILLDADNGFVKYYLSSFGGLYLEAYDDDMSESSRDSIIKRIPYCILEVKTKNELSKKLTVYLKGIDNRTKERYDDEGNILPYDRDKYFALVDDEKEIAYIQDYNFGRLFKTADDFKIKRK